MNTNRAYFGYALVGLGVLLLLILIYRNSGLSTVTRTFSPYTLITSSWEKYKAQFINQDGRVIDYSQNGITTSEGQSYALLRAVWTDDKPEFDLVWKWTKENLKRPSDNLFGWRWGQLGGNAYGFLPNGGENSAADADADIALALILANRRWNQQTYLDQAKPILNDLWTLETGEASGERYLIAGNWANDGQQLIINPSYFAPYAWRIFAKVDTQHDWNSLIIPAYDVLEASTKSNLDKAKSANLPPDWVSINVQNGQLGAASVPNLTTNYSFDAIRVPWRIALDYQWNKEQRAAAYLQSNFGILKDDFNQNDKIAGSYTHDGIRLYADESPAMYATSLGYFMVSDQNLAKKIFEEKILRLYSNDTNSFNTNLNYYEQNWLWFGAGLYSNSLIPFE